jgi:hypothetical protein
MATHISSFNLCDVSVESGAQAIVGASASENQSAPASPKVGCPSTSGRRSLLKILTARVNCSRSSGSSGMRRRPDWILSSQSGHASDHPINAPVHSIQCLRPQVPLPARPPAARLIRTPSVATASEKLPRLDSELNFVYAYIGADDRVFEYYERILQSGDGNLILPLWNPLYAPLRKTERFKAYVRNAGLVDYWRARGWPDLCRPMGADDFVCD